MVCGCLFLTWTRRNSTPLFEQYWTMPKTVSSRNTRRCLRCLARATEFDRLTLATPYQQHVFDLLGITTN